MSRTLVCDTADAGRHLPGRRVPLPQKADTVLPASGARHFLFNGFLILGSKCFLFDYAAFVLAFHLFTRGKSRDVPISRAQAVVIASRM